MDQETNNGQSMNGGSQTSSQSAGSEQMAQTSAPEAAADNGVSEHKLFAIVGYILPFLFFIPLLQESSKNNSFARFHANQQLILLILWVGVQIILSNVLYMVMSMGAYAIMPLLNLVMLVLMIMGIINAAQGQMKELPVVGKFRILK